MDMLILTVAKLIRKSYGTAMYVYCGFMLLTTWLTGGDIGVGTFINLLLGGKLNNYLTEVDRQAEELFLRLVNQMAAQESISEQLKVENQMEWVRRMNSVRARTEEIIYVALIYR